MSKNETSFYWKPFLSGLAVMAVASLAIAAILYWVDSGRRYHPHGHQAVFLTNGQVYFGVIQSQDGNEVQMTDIYYLQNDNPTPNAGDVGQSDMKLIKLGNELHGPKDRMYINRGQVLFIEDLKDDSKVVQAMQDYKP